MSGTKEAGGAAPHHGRCGEVKEFASAARYIPMPESLWALRHRFPNVTRSVLLQCVRCHRWVAQPVTTHPPDEVPTCPTRLEKLASRPKTDRRQRPPTEEGAPKEEWRSPRLHRHYEKVMEVVKPAKLRGQEEPKEVNAYYIPNPANFTCQWVYCALEDAWTDLREQWLGELYATLDGVRGEEEGGSSNSSKGARLRCTQQSPKDQLNEELVKELHGKRSERLARKPHNGMDNKHEKSETHGIAAEVLLNGRLAQQVGALIHHDEVVVASFCWISCDRCGKLRRVHQPFPGGAPFVCALALNIGSCSVPEQEGLGPVFCGQADQVSESDRTEGIVGDLALRDVVGAEVSAASATAVAASPSDNAGNGATKTMASSGRRVGRSPIVGSTSVCKGSASVKVALPLLRELTAALRKRALGAFVKNILTVPEEVRAKRESVVRASIVVAEGLKHADSVSPKREERGGDSPDALRSTLPPESRNQPRQAEKGEEKREAVGQQSLAVVPAETSTRVAQVPCKEEAPRRCRRLGCPPRRMRAEAREEGAQTRVDSGPLPPIEDIRPEETSERTSAVRLEAVETPPAAAADPGCTDASLNGARVKREASAPAPAEPVARAAEAPSKGCLPKKVSGRKRTRPPKTEDAQQNIDASDDVDNTRGIRGAKPRGVLGRVEDDATKKALNEEEVEIIHWVCCDLCDKWRIVPEKISEGTSYWHCEMRADGTTCSDTDDEVRMKRSERRGRKRKKQNKRGDG
ncbi:uncharacterized protein Tco025E_01675 [Trypanosoma conorhini]|uniref:CW-type domain-containing protein n=1 Tax=Trypanosoma conorhini TaxID=83891 RepID=A0A422Q7W1_9TRYP|nr:uncharacterized protein Tco025E_01675 [Trypanosoma conorhini]RNF26046.1 hypothetical protein Tco025E_01675 [Trypanosoma conorhini]